MQVGTGRSALKNYSCASEASDQYLQLKDTTLCTSELVNKFVDFQTVYVIMN